MRCKCCDSELSFETPVINKHTGKEDDLCSSCRRFALHPVMDHEYFGGWYPSEGVTAPLPTGD